MFTSVGAAQIESSKSMIFFDVKRIAHGLVV